MSRPSSTLDEEPCVIVSPTRDRDEAGSESDTTTDDEEKSVVSVNKKFKDIMNDLKNGSFDPCDAAKLEHFAAHNASYLGQKMTADSDHNTLLHLLVVEAKDKVINKYKPLVKLLIDRHPNLLGEKDSNEKTPLYIAISKKRDKLVRFMCDIHHKIDDILSIPCYRCKNCLHIAVQKDIPKLATFLISRASEGTLCAKDDKGNTPLHLAVDYKRCTDAQLGIVHALTLQCDRAMDARTSAPDAFSPFRYHEHTRAGAKTAKEKEKESSQRKKDEASAAGMDGLAEKDAVGVKPKFATQALDMKTQKPVGPKEQGAETDKTNMSNEAPLRKYGGAGGIYSGSGLMGGGYRNAGLEFESSIEGLVNSNGKGSNPRTPVMPIANPRQEREKEKAKVTEESAAAIRDYLKLHYMRTRNHDETVDFLYGRNQEKQINFDLYDSLLTISEERIEEGLRHIKFEDVLQYVALPSMQLEKNPILSKHVKRTPKSDGNGRSDMIFLFNFLRNKGVQRVIRVIVDDTLAPAHSDEAIEKALKGLKVEIWDWRKVDLSTDTIITAAPDAREISLYWSGNNAVLRGWTAKDGLSSLTKLMKGLETAKRTHNNVSEFHRRLKELFPDIDIEDIEGNRPKKHDQKSGPDDTSHEQGEQRHKWLTCMDEFADFIQNVEAPPQPHKPVTIALIDDGVNINEQCLYNKIVGGQSFCHRDEFQNLSKPYYVTSGGHGTVMASMICRVFPMAQLYIVKLDEYLSEHSKRQITAKSAAKASPHSPPSLGAVRAAIDKQVHIISMSWTIERTPRNETDISNLESAIEAAAKAGILMFCAANDQGIACDHSFPAACGGTKHLFKIGAAEASGTVWKWVGDPSEVDFILPGHNVVKERPNDAPLEKCRTLTGSSVATALAAGLAALVLHCVQLAALNAQLHQQTGRKGNAITMEDVKDIQRHERMKEAFLAIETSPASGNKYIEVWNFFEPAAQKAEKVSKEEKIEIVTGVAERLKMRKTFK